MGIMNGTDMLSLLSVKRLTSSRPFSNISEYCLRDGDAVSDYLVKHREEDLLPSCSDFDLFRKIWMLTEKDRASYFSKRLRDAVAGLIDKAPDNMTVEEIWSLSADILESKGFNIEADRVGVAVLPNQLRDATPSKLGNTALYPVVCPFGTHSFDLSVTFTTEYEKFDMLFDSADQAAMFVKGFEFEEPNEYVAKSASEKLSNGQKISDRERRILSSQLCRKMMMRCAENGKELLIILPSSPDVYSMGELTRLLGYMDVALSDEKLRITVFAADAVGLCYASSVLASRYKKITADTGICGNGCGTPSEECAVYWGVDRLPLKRASLASTPAFIGR